MKIVEWLFGCVVVLILIAATITVREQSYEASLLCNGIVYGLIITWLCRWNPRKTSSRLMVASVVVPITGVLMWILPRYIMPNLKHAFLAIDMPWSQHSLPMYSTQDAVVIGICAAVTFIAATRQPRKEEGGEMQSR